MLLPNKLAHQFRSGGKVRYVASTSATERGFLATTPSARGQPRALVQKRFPTLSSEVALPSDSERTRASINESTSSLFILDMHLIC